MAYESSYRSIKVKSGKIGNVTSKVVMPLIGTFAEFTFPFNAETATSQASTLAKVYDLSATEYQDLATSGTGAGYTANYQLFPDTEAIGDYALFGAAAPFGVIRIDVSATAATYGADAIKWYYWNGDEWSLLTIIWDDTNTTPAAAGLRPFMQDGNIVFSAPTDWAAVEIDGQSAYWVKANVYAAQLTQIPLLDSLEHYIITDTNAFSCPYDGEIGEGRFTFVTNSGSTDHADVILCNLSSGACSAIKVITKALYQGVVIADFDLLVSAGDHLAIYGTDEDGTTEYANGQLELDILRK